MDGDANIRPLHHAHPAVAHTGIQLNPHSDRRDAADDGHL
jgi:hypothetical protein